MNALSPTFASPVPRRGARLFAAGLVLALAGSFALTALAQPAPEGGRPPHAGHHEGRHGHGGPGGGWLLGRGLDRALDSVKATDAQRTEIRRIADAARSDLRAQAEGGRALRQRSLELFGQPTVDAAAAETLRQQLLQQHDAASKRVLQAALEASRVLTPEQRAQLVQQAQKRREGMERRWGERGAPGRPGAASAPR